MRIYPHYYISILIITTIYHHILKFQARSTPELENDFFLENRGN
jgi:hypothetical protein